MAWLRSLFSRAPPAPPPQAISAVSFFRLRSAQGPFLALPTTGPHLTRQAAIDPGLPAIAIIPDALPHMGFLASPDGRAFGIPGDPLAAVALSVRILRTSQRGIVRLKQPLGGHRFLELDAPDARPHFDGAGTTMAAAFALIPAPAADVPVILHSLASEIGRAAAGGLRQAHLLACLRDGLVRPALAESLLRLLPRDELDDLASRALDEPQTLALLARMLPQDAFLATYLPGLIAWRAARDALSAHRQSQSPAADEGLIRPCMNDAGLPVGMALHTLARGHVAPRRGICLLATARNEGPYVLEWLAYHLSVGFEHVFLYTNDNTDGSDDLLAALADQGVITLVRNARGPRIGVQEKAYAHALTLMPQILDYRWAAALDLDEYFAFDAGMFDTVGDFIALQEAQPVDAVALCWLLFLSGIGDRYSARPTNQRFLSRSAEVNAHVKSMFRPRMFWGSQPHYPYPTLDAPFNYRLEDGSSHHHPGVTDRIAAYSARPTAEKAWINHYIFRTAPEALWKQARDSAAWTPKDDVVQRPNHADFIARNFVDLAAPEKLVADRRILACAQKQSEMLEKLLALPRVAECNAAVQRAFQERLTVLAKEFLAATPANASPVMARFRDAVAAAQGMALKGPVVMPARSRMI
jgi:hypothetical protein